MDPVSERYKTAKSVLLELLPKQTINDVMVGICDHVLNNMWRDLNDRIDEDSTSDTQKVNNISSICIGLSENLFDNLDATPLEDIQFVDFVEAVDPDNNSSENITPNDSYKHVFFGTANYNIRNLLQNVFQQ